MEHQRSGDSDAGQRGDLAQPSSSYDGIEANKLVPAEGPKPASDYFKAIGMDPSRFWPKKYRFTREKPTGHFNPLTISQRNFYETNGYLVFDDCASKKLLGGIRDSFKRNETAVSQGLVDELLLRNERLLKYARCFCDDRLMLMSHRLVDSFQAQDMRDVIDNGQQQRQTLSRDWMYLPFRPIDRVCCAITAIEPLEHVLLVVPGTHRVGQCSISSSQSREIFESSSGRLSTLIEKSRKGFVYIDLKPGQALFYHPGLIHGFNQDLINFRKSQLVSIAYYAAADCEYIDLLPQPAESSSADRLPMPIGLAHFGPDNNPLDYNSWLDKPRLINTRDAHL